MEKPLFSQKRDILKGVLPAQRNVIAVPMSQFRRIDPTLDGIRRFAYAVGNTASTMVSKTSFTLFDAAVVGNNSITTLNVDIEDISNCIVVIDRQETIVVASQNTYRDSYDRKITNYVLESTVKFNHFSDAECVVEAFEVYRMSGSEFLAGQSVLQLSSRKPLIAGDQLAKLVNTDFNAVLSNYVEIDSVSLDSTSGDLYNYTVVTKYPLTYDADTTSRLFIKAVPAYSSNRMLLNTESSYVYLDTTHGKTFGSGQTDIVIGFSTYDVSGRKLSSGRYSVNDYLAVRTVTVQEIAAMVVERGVIHVSDKLICECDDEGLFALGSQFPEMDLELGFDIVGSDVTLIIEMDSGTTTQVISGTTRIHQTGTTQKLIMRLVGRPGTHVEFSNIVSPSNRIHSITYTLLANIELGESFEMTGLVIKPVFKSAIDCTTTDDLIELNKGFMLR
jgi:hypothetical protein